MTAPPGIATRGEAPFGTCFMQAVAAVATGRGVPDATARLGPSWGFRRVAAHRLSGGERWLAGASRLTGLALHRFAHTDWERLSQVEQAALGRGEQLIAAVDSFDVSSPYRGTEHLTHAVVVHRHTTDHVVVADMMNHPEPYALPLHEYRRTRLSPVAAGIGIVCGGGPARLAPIGIVVERLRAEVAVHRAEQAVFAGFLADIGAGAIGTEVDIADVAAERLALGQVLAPLAVTDEWWAPIAEAFTGLAKQWYLAHAMAWEAAHGAGTLRAPRLVRMLTTLAAREAELNAQLDAALSPSRAA